MSEYEMEMVLLLLGILSGQIDPPCIACGTCCPNCPLYAAEQPLLVLIAA